MTRAVVMMALASTLIGCGGSDGVGPVIDSVDPTAAFRGDDVELTGKRFCGDEAGSADDSGACTTPPNGVVNLGMGTDIDRAMVRAWSDTAITAQIPETTGQGAALVWVTVNGVSSNELDFEVQ